MRGKVYRSCSLQHTTRGWDNKADYLLGPRGKSTRQHNTGTGTCRRGGSRGDVHDCSTCDGHALPC